MKKIIKAISKQLFGAKYESLGKSLLVCGILFLALYTTEIKISIAPFILYLTSIVFTGCIMWQTIRSRHHVKMLQGIFMLPFEERVFVFSYVLTVGSYTLITKTMPIWTLFLAVGSWSSFEIIVALICGCSACFVSAAFYLLCKKKLILSLVGISCILAIILVARHSVVILSMAVASLVTAIIYLFFTDAYSFYYSVAVKRTVRYTGNKSNIFVYLVRYLLENKNYLFNTVGLCVVAGFLPLLFGKFEGLNALPLGFAILSLNTPICTLLSCDLDLERAVKTLPGQVKNFCNRYCLFIGSVSFVTSCIYICSWQIINGGISVTDVWLAILFVLQSAILSAILEWVYPLHNWKTESDLWHHPRKYFVPVVMLMFATFVGTWTLTIWIWSVVLLIECCVLSGLIRRF